MAGLASDRQGVLTACPSCGKTNRLRYGSLQQAIRCGQCKTPLPAPDSPVEVPSAAAFDAMVADSPLPVVVDFWAAWCGPCRMMAPEVDTVARSLSGRALVTKVDTEAVPDLAARFGIQSIPTLAVFRDGREVSRVSGARPAAEIQRLVEG